MAKVLLSGITRDLVAKSDGKLLVLVNWWAWKEIKFYSKYIFPNTLKSQDAVFESQLENYINPNGTVTVLSAFPVLIIDYYGVNKIMQQLEELEK